MPLEINHLTSFPNYDINGLKDTFLLRVVLHSYVSVHFRSFFLVY